MMIIEICPDIEDLLRGNSPNIFDSELRSEFLVNIST
jgi:hypothetical protein